MLCFALDLEMRLDPLKGKKNEWKTFNSGFSRWYSFTVCPRSLFNIILAIIYLGKRRR